MQTKQIKLESPNEVNDFVTAASKCNFDIDIFYNRVIIDAKSFLGIMSMDLTQTLKVTYRGFDQEFEKTLQKYAKK